LPVASMSAATAASVVLSELSCSLYSIQDAFMMRKSVGDWLYSVRRVVDTNLQNALTKCLWS